MTDITQFRKLAQPPAWALKTIGGGRLRGMTDIKPAWRIQAMTEVYGLCGVGWRYEVVKQWTEPASDGQVFAFVDILLSLKVDGEWAWPVPGTGGNMLIEKEKNGLHSNDEAFKMATTDALSSAMRMIGMAADIYAGQWTGSKYNRQAEVKPAPTEKDRKDVDKATDEIRNATTTDDLKAAGLVIKDKYSPVVQNIVRDAYESKWKQLKSKEDAAAMEPVKE